MTDEIDKANLKQQAENLAKFQIGLEGKKIPDFKKPSISNVPEEIEKVRFEIEQDLKQEGNLPKGCKSKLDTIQKEIESIIETNDLTLETIFLIGLKHLALIYWIEKINVENPLIIPKIDKAIKKWERNYK